jgi:hypothetical protein
MLNFTIDFIFTYCSPRQKVLTLNFFSSSQSGKSFFVQHCPFQFLDTNIVTAWEVHILLKLSIVAIGVHVIIVDLETPASSSSASFYGVIVSRARS